jgi:RND family efflux transporter MFP subunit
VKKLMILLVVIAVLLAGGVSCYRKARVSRMEPAKTVLTAEVKQGPLIVTVRGSGDIRSIESVKIIPRIKRGVVITYLVPDGTQVSSNDVIARFNTDEMERKIKDIEINLSDAQNRLLSAQTELEIQVMDNTSNIKKGEQDLESARMALQKQKEGDEPMERRNAEVKLQTAESDYSRKQRRYEELKTLVKDGFVTEDEVEEERIQLETSKLSSETAAIEKRLLNDYTIPLNRTSSEATLAKALTDLEKSRKQTDALYRTKKQAVEVAQRAVDRIKLDMEAAEEELSALGVKTPISGMLMYGNPDQPWRRGEIEVGANFSPGQVLMTIPDRSAMQAVINIPEADIRNVRVGQQATVTVEALGERNFSGRITKVAEVANSGGGWGGDVKEFKVEIALGSAGDLRPGFSCQAEIITETVPSAVYLPVHAVFRDGEKFYVYPVSGGAADGRREVVIGRSSIQYVEIVKGLTPGMRIYLNPPEAPASKP